VLADHDEREVSPFAEVHDLLARGAQEPRHATGGQEVAARCHHAYNVTRKHQKHK
jgi:hypothetical protein